LKLIFIYGPPATGKLTVAQELAAITGYKLFHNHLALDLLLSVFEFGSVPFVELREQIWLWVFDQAARTKLPGLIFTFAPEPTVRPAFIPQAVATIEGNGGEVFFIELSCPMTELKRRIDNPTRLHFGKLTSVALFDQLVAEGAFDASHMPRPSLSIDTSLSTPQQAAAQIRQALALDELD
jgi:hypothetical protein